MARTDVKLDHAIEEAARLAANDAAKAIKSCGFYLTERAKDKLVDMIADWLQGRVIVDA